MAEVLTCAVRANLRVGDLEIAAALQPVSAAAWDAVGGADPAAVHRQAQEALGSLRMVVGAQPERDLLRAVLVQVEAEGEGDAADGVEAARDDDIPF